MVDAKEILKDHNQPVYLHIDQGSVYSSLAYNELIKDSVLVRSMSRASTPTDNPVNEYLNGWIKEELYTDFALDKCITGEQIVEKVRQYVKYYNTERQS